MEWNFLKARFFDGPALASLYFNKVVVDPNWTYDFAIWIGKDVDYSPYVLEQPPIEFFFRRKTIYNCTELAFVADVCVLRFGCLLVNLSSE